jgi:hypothetical protein
VLLVGNVFFALQHPIGWVGVILLATGILGICPLYSLLGINTKPAAERIGLKEPTGRLPTTQETLLWICKVWQFYSSSVPSRAGSRVC